jgi:ribosomal-protein-alanine N-acetyltransferase
MTASSLTFVAAGREHAPVIAAAHQLCFEDGWDETAISRLMAMPGAFGLIAMASSGPAAFVLCRAAAGECEILTFGVLPPCRGKGTGAELLRLAFAEAENRGADRMFLEVADVNQPARRLYESAGFTVVGRRPGYYAGAGGKHNADALILACDLSNA